jgi:hypothetical protein
MEVDIMDLYKLNGDKMKNLITNNYYSGGNLDTLAEAGYTEDDSMVTFKQAMKHFEVTGDMLKGLKGLGTTLCFYKEQENKLTGKKEMVRKLFTVFDSKDVIRVIEHNTRKVA